jgi:SAM-dependent methyltransferase
MLPEILNSIILAINLVCFDMNTTSSNQTTLHSYERAAQTYIEKTPREVSGLFKGWIDTTLHLLNRRARILEIGSGFGRDAAYIESLGFNVVRTDAAESFVKHLQFEGYLAHKFNLLTDDLNETYDLVFANAVFLHFSRGEFLFALEKISRCLSKDGLLAFTLKRGEGEEWEVEKLGEPRYFHYWSLDEIYPILTYLDYRIVYHSQDEHYLLITIQKGG